MKKKKHRFQKFLIKICLILIVVCPITMIVSKAVLSSVNMDVEVLKKEVVRKKNSNESLSMKVNELKSLANIDVIAEVEGLSYNSSNIKVISNR